jgi:hypothetical protein
VARPIRFHVCAAIGRLARRRAFFIPCSRISFLVARHSALAECRARTALAHPLLPFSCHATLRHSFRISQLLRSSRLPGLPQHAQGIRNFPPCRPAMRGRFNVELHHDPLSTSGRHSHDPIAHGADFSRGCSAASGATKDRGPAKRSSRPGGCLIVYSVCHPNSV